MAAQDPATRAGDKAYAIIGKPFKNVLYQWRAVGTKKYLPYVGSTQLMNGDQIYVKLDKTKLTLTGGICLHLIRPFGGTLMDGLWVGIAAGQDTLYVQVIADGDSSETNLSATVSSLPLPQVPA